MISIVLPTYNGEKYIRQSIDSIIKQTITDWELIIVNDCSTDNTLKIINEYVNKDSRIHVINNVENKKLPASLNIGFDNAKGDLFTWTSDDNAYAPNALEVLSYYMRKEKADLVFSNFWLIDHNDYILAPFMTGPAEILPLYCSIGASFLYKRKVHEELGGYDVNKFLVEDYDFWLRAYRKYKYFHINKLLYYYRLHADSLTSTKNIAVQEKTIKLLEENIKYIDSDELKSKVENKIFQYYKKKNNLSENK